MTIEEGWLLNSETGLALLHYLSKEASKRASQFKSTNSSHATPNTSELISARLDQNMRQPSCVMGILSRAHLSERSYNDNTALFTQPSLTGSGNHSSSNVTDDDGGSGFNSVSFFTSSSSSHHHAFSPEWGIGSFWNSIKHLHHWTIRLHGDAYTGKTALSLALCRLQFDNQMTSHTDTPGLVLRECLVPIKLIQDKNIKWVRLEVEDVGSFVQSKYNYLKYDAQKRMFHVHIVMISMTDLQSLESAKDTIRYLNKECHVDLKRILAVATKVDEFQNYQITDSDLHDFVSSMGISLCLVNNYAQFGEQYSSYAVVEELARILL